MIETDIAIVGGGMAGSTTAAMLTQMGHDAVVVDPHQVYPPDFRCEKLDALQIELLNKTGLGDVILSAVDNTDCIWISRHGRIVEKRPTHQCSAKYETFVNVMRTAIGDPVKTVTAKVTAIETSADRQRLTLSNSEQISARLVVLANGLNNALRASLGLQREEISPAHSISVGFDVVPVGRDSFPYRALTYYPEDVSQRIAYLSLFPFGDVMRANLFLYRDKHDPWLRKIRTNPKEALLEVLPNVRAMTGDFDIVGDVHVRPADLYVTTDVAHDGVVLVGDAFGTSCPAAGTGFNKVFTDVERLCHAYIPRWLETPGMTAEKIASFYGDPAKIASDEASLAKAMLTRKVATENGLRWRVRRNVRYVGQVVVGALRQMRAPSPAPATLASYGRGGEPK
jgi:2-polyprenyl-6-methoxyphenol hydroxylase-like FAD-dependent oxidoreductase